MNGGEWTKIRVLVNKNILHKFLFHGKNINIFRDFCFWVTIKQILNFCAEWTRVGQVAAFHPILVVHLLSPQVLVPPMFLVLHDLLPHLLHALPSLVSHVLSCIACSSCFVACVLRVAISVFLFLCSHSCLIVYFLLVSFFQKFIIIKIQIVYAKHFNITVSINQ